MGRREFAILRTNANLRIAVVQFYVSFFLFHETANGMHEDDPSARKQLARFKEEGQRAVKGQRSKEKKREGL